MYCNNFPPWLLQWKYHFSSGVSLKLQEHRRIPWIFEVAALLEWSILLYSVSLWGVEHITKCHSDTWVVSKGGERRKTSARLPSLEVPAHTARASWKRGLGGFWSDISGSAHHLTCHLHRSPKHRNTEPPHEPRLGVPECSLDSSAGGGSPFSSTPADSLKRPLSRHALLKVGGIPQLGCRESPCSTLYNYVSVSLLPPF